MLAEAAAPAPSSKADEKIDFTIAQLFEKVALATFFCNLNLT